MLFNSYSFIFAFLPITLVLFLGLAKLRLLRLATVWLAIASFGFYAYWNIAYLPLLLISIVGNYGIGRQIERAKPQTPAAKGLLYLGIAFNLCLLAYYKYASFFANSLNSILATEFTLPKIILPLAISFYSFTQIAYIVDAYRGETKAYRYNFLTYSLFISFFPQLIAGPILRYDELLPQLRRLRHFLWNPKNLALGLTLFILGLFKKVAIADNLSPWVSPIFTHADSVTFLEAWVGALSYTFQLYFDFSGYSDMAIGLGWMFNIHLPVNFNSPYKATSITDFWRRWHITLSNFLRDYLYIPLGGNRKGRLRQSINLLITMLLGGLWHGAGWTFVIWGGLHGLFLTINRLWQQLQISLPKLLGWLITFGAVVASWVLFRAPTLEEGLAILQTMVGIKSMVLPTAYQPILGWLTPLGVEFKGWLEFPYLPPLGGQKSLLVLAFLLLVVSQCPNTQQIIQQFKPTWWVAAIVTSLAVFCLLSLNQVSEFLYFQF
ncbi:MBOAT family O-acyltransferase [Coleofasciculus sp. F4-SAH-05]|uniref:MBOAT family O-acyltransferase n=1 Tax=Coleofasciculus sp. F4-SAH-05 TaxID=3069525 RepID=UPI0033011096